MREVSERGDCSIFARCCRRQQTLKCNAFIVGFRSILFIDDVVYIIYSTD